MISQARVVIIGGGMMGAGLLYHLAEEGWQDVLLIEKGELTSGSTWHAAGQCPSFTSDYNMGKIHHYGNSLYPKLEAMTGQYVSWHGCGGIRFATTDSELEYFKYVEGLSRLIGYRMQIIGPDEIKRINPHVDLQGVMAGAWTLDDGHVDPSGCCNALAKGACDMGASISKRNRVLDIKQHKNGEWAIYTEQGKVIAEHVVNAAGCYARQIQHMINSDAPITNMKHQYIVTDPVEAFIQSDVEMPVMRDPYPSAYYRQEQKSALIGIYETENAQEAWQHTKGMPEWDAENELFNPDLDSILPFVERVMERMPIWSELGIRRIVNGAIPHTPDANPLLGPVGGAHNFWMCAGSSIGIAQGAGCGKYLAQWIVHGEAEINMAGFDPRRFDKWADTNYTRARNIEDYEHMYKLHVPGEERAAGRNQRISKLHHTLLSKGAVMSATAGWERAKYYDETGALETPSFARTNAHDIVKHECKSLRDNVGIADLSAFAKFDITGKDTSTFLTRVFANTIPKSIGGIGLCHMLNNHGHIQGEVTLTRFSDDHFYALSGLLSERRDMDWLCQHIKPGEDVTIRNVTNDYGILLVAGPKSRELLTPLCQDILDHASFKWLSAKVIHIAGIPLRAMRVNYIGELGWELHCPVHDLERLYEVIAHAGQAFNMTHFGMYAVNSMRMEKAYRGMDSELTNEITLIESDMERFIKFDKADFIGKSALQELKQKGVKQKLIYFSVDCDLYDIKGGESIANEAGDMIGITTSGAYGHRTDKNLGFAYVKYDFSHIGTSLFIHIMGEIYEAVILDGPIYDVDNIKLRA